jgi:two-component system, NtrC family, nitrogen regulation sensor histidine kinase NtrY
MASERPASPPAARNRVPLGPSRRRLSFEKRLRLWLYLLGVPMLALAMLLLFRDAGFTFIAWITVAAIVAAWMLAASFLMEQILRPLQTLSNVVAALREDDYSFRARGARRNDAMGDLALEINALAGMLQTQRAGALEAMALVERVMASMESPVLAFDPEDRLRMLNAAGERAFGISAVKALGTSAESVKLHYLLTAQDGEVVSLRRAQGAQAERWVVKRTYFRLRGVQHTLLMLSDVSKALRDEERLAWTRLIRVLGHEINNSLTPIKSIAGSLRGRLTALKEVSGERGDFERGLEVIENRSESLNRFLQAYRQLMGLPAPKLRAASLAAMVERVAQLERRVVVTVTPAADVMLEVDTDQMEQALINLVRNAADAALGPDAIDGGAAHVDISWQTIGAEAVIAILDNGPGLTNAGNLFVPFYTTKPGGTGIGLVLAQQIAQAHRGSVELRNRTDGHSGCKANLRLPLVA